MDEADDDVDESSDDLEELVESLMLGSGSKLEAAGGEDKRVR